MKLQHTTVGTRLAIGFSFTLLLLAIAIIFSIWRLHESSITVKRMVDEVMVKERLVAEWAASTNMNGVRTIAVAELSNPARQAELQATIKQTTARISEIQKSLDGFGKTAEEKALYAKIAELRKAYIAQRDAVFREKKLSDEAAHALVEARLKPALDGYVMAINELTAFQAIALAHMRDEIATVDIQSRWMLIVLGIISVLLSLAVAFVIARSIRGQLGGEPSQAMAIASSIAQGDLAIAIQTKTSDSTSLMSSMNEMRDGLARIVNEVRVGSDVIAEASSQIAAGNLDLASRTETQASSLEETATSLDQVTSTARQNASHVRQALSLARSASAVASDAGTIVTQTVQTMDAINDSSQKIADIVNVIDGIAFQTNILALNAAVEAARAGEHGKGFAVVATEVRQLAQRSAGAAKQIKVLIEDSVGQVDDGAKLVDRAGMTMQKVVTGIQQVTDIMAEIAAATDEQTSGIEDINSAIKSMDAMAQQNAALVEEASAASSSLREQAAKLAEAVGRFKIANAVDKHQYPRREGSHPGMEVKTRRIHSTKPEQLAKPAQLSLSAPKMGSPGSRGSTDEWEEF